MSRRTKVFLIVAALLLVAGGYGAYRLWGLRKRESVTARPLNVRTFTVRQGQLSTLVEATGNLGVAREQTLTFRTSGTVKAINVSEGDRVSRGTRLATLDTADLDLQVRNAEQSLRSQEAALAALKATPMAEDVAAARASLEQAQKNLEKVEAGPTKEELASAEASLKSAQEAYQQLLSKPDPDAIAQAKLKVEQAKNSLWSAQIHRDDVCGKAESNATFWSECESAKAQVGNATIAVQLAELAYKQAQEPPTDAQLAGALAQVRNAEVNLARLHDSPTEAEVAAARAQVAKAQSSLAKLLRGPTDEALAQAEARVEQARIALEQARRNVEKAQMIAPFDGKVANIGFDVGSRVSPNGPGLTLVDMSHFYADVQVNEVEIGQVKVGQPVFLSVDAYPNQVLNGKVTFISPVGKSTQGVVTYRVRVEIEPTDLPLLPDMTITARINVGRGAKSLLVPLLALHSDARGNYVEVLQPDGTPRKVYVQVGQQSNAMVEVKGNLHSGDKVVLPQRNAAEQTSGGGRRLPFRGGLFGGRAGQRRSGRGR